MFSAMLDLIRRPGLQLEWFCAGLLAAAVLVYLARVAWIALSEARRMESHAVKLSTGKGLYSGPSSAG